MPNKTFPTDAVYGAMDYANMDDTEDGLRRSYSGRGMYGAECFGVVGSERELYLFCAGLADYACECEGEDGSIRFDVQSLIEHAATDSMGRDMILYFPGYTLED